MKNFIHNFIYIIVPSFVLLICFVCFSLKSNAAEMTLSNALRSALVIGSQYIVARNGQTLDNSASENINDGDLGSISVKPDYLSVVSQAFNNAIPNIPDLISTAKDFDVSNLNQSELSKFNQLVLGDDNLSGSNVVFKQATINGITAYWAVNQAGEWIGNSINNIAVRIAPKTETLSNNLDNVLETDYNFKDLLYSDNGQFQVTDRNINVNAPLTYVLDLNFYVYLFSSDNVVYCVIPSSRVNDSLGRVTIVGSSGPISGSPFSCHIEYDNTTRFTIDGVTYIYGYINMGNPWYAVYSDSAFSSLETIKSQIALKGYVGDVVYSDIKDLTNDQGYTVPDIGFSTVPISDIYDSLQSLENAITGLREGLNGVVDGLSSGISAQDIQDILDAINQAISKGLVLDNSITDPLPLPEYDDQGIAIPPDFNNDLFSNTFSVFKLPFNFFSIFEPIFYSFGSFAMMFGLFQFIPFALIVLVLIWVLK